MPTLFVLKGLKTNMVGRMLKVGAFGMTAMFT